MRTILVLLLSCSTAFAAHLITIDLIGTEPPTISSNTVDFRLGDLHILLTNWTPAISTRGATWIPGTTNQPRAEPPVWERPRLSEIALQWEPNPDADRYRVDYKSNRTTNRWVTADFVKATGDANAVVNHSIFVDLSVPVWTRVVAITETHYESAPSNPVRHPAINPPRPMGKHKQMFSREVTNAPRRNRAEPLPVFPEPPLPE